MGSSAVRVSFGERISLGRHERRFLRSWWWRHADQRGFPHGRFANHGFLLRCLHRRRSFGSRLLWGGGLLGGGRFFCRSRDGGGNRFLQNLFRRHRFLSRRCFFHCFFNRRCLFHCFCSRRCFFHCFFRRRCFFHGLFRRCCFFHGLFRGRCFFRCLFRGCCFFHCFLNRRRFFCRDGFFRGFFRDGFFRGAFRRHDEIFFGGKGYAPCLWYVGGTPPARARWVSLLNKSFQGEFSDYRK